VHACLRVPAQDIYHRSKPRLARLHSRQSR
jgi:hypothetical protein